MSPSTTVRRAPPLWPATARDAMGQGQGQAPGAGWARANGGLFSHNGGRWLDCARHGLAPPEGAAAIQFLVSKAARPCRNHVPYRK